MPVMPSRRTLRRLSVAGLAVLTAIVPVSAQQPQATAPAASQAPAGPTLTLTMDQAVQMALDTSLGLKSERINVDVASQSIIGARAAFLPALSGQIRRNNAESQPILNPDGTRTVPTSNQLDGSTTVQQQLPFLGSFYSATWSSNRRATGGGGGSFNPSLGSTVNLQFSAPLWRDLKIDQLRAGVDRAQRQQLISDLALQQRVVGTEATVRQAYLQLKAALESKKVADLNMELAETSLRNARARVAVGQSPELDIITNEASVATQRTQVIDATAQIASAEDNLRVLILDQGRPDYWTITIFPADEISVTERQVDVDAAIKNALTNRLDIVTLRRNMEISDLNIRLADNNTKPQVDAFVNYLASGTGGRQSSADGTVTNIGYGSVLGDSFGGAYPSWTYGLNVQYPLGRNAALVNKATNELTKQQQQLNMRDLELQVVGDVRQAARDISTSYQRYIASRTAREALEKQLNAEDRKFAVGLSNTFDVQLRQRDLASSRVNELNAIIRYNQALIEFERVQKIR